MYLILGNPSWSVVSCLLLKPFAFFSILSVSLSWELSLSCWTQIMPQCDTQGSSAAGAFLTVSACKTPLNSSQRNKWPELLCYKPGLLEHTPFLYFFFFRTTFKFVTLAPQKRSAFISLYHGSICMSSFSSSSHIQGSYLIFQLLQTADIEVFIISKTQSPQPVSMTYFPGSWTSYFLSCSKDSGCSLDPDNLEELIYYLVICQFFCHLWFLP